MIDSTDSNWVTMFQDQGENILGVSSNELASLRENNPDSFQKVFNEATFKEFFFKLRVKMETYNVSILFYADSFLFSLRQRRKCKSL